MMPPTARIMGATATSAVYVLTTGGTMEKVYSEQTGDVANVESKINRYLRMLRAAQL